jgi:teichuronic acid biosynthesis glycosyltransferase TuaC
MPDLLATVPNSLYDADAAADLVRAVREQAREQKRADVAIDNWAEIVSRMNEHILRIAGRN